MRRKLWLLIVILCSWVLVSGCSDTSSIEGATEEKVLKIGYQKNGPLIILKSLGDLDKRLDSEGWKVEWNQFQTGPALLEALNAGSIDFGRTGNTPPIFAQVAGADFKYVAVGNTKMKGSGILVPEDSDIQSIGDLKGKTVSFAKGSSSHYLIVKALESVGLTYDDINPAFLSPGDARIAFEQGDVDAMVVWDPFTADTELNGNGRLLVDGDGLTTDRDFFVTVGNFDQDHPEIVEILLEEIQNASDWANNNHDKLVDMMAPILGIDEDSIRLSAERRIYGLDTMTQDTLNEQQDIADLFYELKIIPKKINVEETMTLN